MEHSPSRDHRETKRGRPAKFGRPARLVALTLPEDVIRALHSINPDIGWAVVKLTESLTKSRDQSQAAEEPQPQAELAHLPNRRALVVVRQTFLRDLPGVTMIPLSDGRAFLAFSGSNGIADLELALIDRIEGLPQGSASMESLAQIRETLRKWRCNPRLQFKTMSIVVVHGVDPNPGQRLGKLKTR